ncbi:hypothetical protein ACLI1A_04650 [Flavobacterium sp. RHBU_3]|uniref:hypothetical protein n=1 Tax=Flavobacterium sp. RHBU_3 TaxID=3391184 RepID=UPI003985302E
MKKILLATALVFSAAAFAQVAKNDGPQFESKSLTVSDDKKQMVFDTDVSYTDDKLTVEHADSIVFDTEKKELTITGGCQYTFYGAVNISKNNDKKQVKYKIGDNTLYVEH